MSDRDVAEGQELSSLLKKFCDISGEQFAIAHPEAFLEFKLEYVVLRGTEKVKVTREDLSLGELRTLGIKFEREVDLIKKCFSSLVYEFILENSELPK